MDQRMDSRKCKLIELSEKEKLIRILFQFLLLTVLICVPISASAAPVGYIDYIDGYAELPGTVPAEDLYIELYDDNGNFVDWTLVESSGYFRIPDIYSAVGPISEGDYELRYLFSQSPDLEDNGLYADSKLTGTFDNGHPGYTVSAETYISISPTVVFSPATAYFEITVEEALSPFDEGQPRLAGDPVANYEMYAWSHDDTDYFFSTRTNASGVAYFPVPADATYVINGYSSNYSSLHFERDPDSLSGATQLTKTVLKGNSTLNVNLVDDTSSSFSVPNNSWGTVKCHRKGVAGVNYEVDLYGGDSGVSMGVVPGSYKCFVRVEGYGAGRFETTVAALQTSNIDVAILTRDAQVEIQAIDGSGVLVTDLNLEFAAWAVPDGTGNSVDDFVWAESGTGSATLDVINGVTYAAAVHDIDESATDSKLRVTSSNGVQYIIPFELVEFTASSAQTTVVQFELTRLDSFLTVTAVDAAGNPVTSGWVDAYSLGDLDSTGAAADRQGRFIRSLPAQDGRKDLFQGAPLGSDGTVVLPLVAGREYQVNVYPDFVNEASMLIPPATQYVTLSDGEQRALTMQLFTPNHTLTVNTSLSSAADGSSVAGSFLTCFGYNVKQQQVFNFVDGADTLTLPMYVNLSNPGVWRIGCERYVTDGENEEIYFGKMDYTAAKRQSTGTINLVLEEDATFYGQETFGFEADEGATFSFADGKIEVEIPAGAFGESGFVEMYIESGRGYTRTDEDNATAAFDISFYMNGEEVSETEKAVILRFLIDPDKLAELGVSAKDFLVGSFNEDTKTWAQDASFFVTTDEDGNSIVVAQVTHFSLWGQLVSLSKQLKASSPTSLKARKQKGTVTGKKRKVTLRWDAPTGASDDQQYEVDLVVMSKKNKKYKKKGGDLWDKAKTYEATGNSLKRRLKIGQKFRFRVRVKDGTNSDEKNFRIRS